ncbi:MAG: YfiR family protein [Candidatus Eisenbacteria bacterium]|nr:YfiR family protein [Candidatus Eisenbacteria bacterium]
MIPLRFFSGRRFKPAFAVAAFSLCILSADRILADQQPTTELQIKGAYLMNFARLVTWPEGSYRSEDDPTIIGILGDDRLLEILDDALETHQPQSRPIVLLRIDSLEQISQCHLLYVSRKTDRSLEEILKRVDGNPILTVSDIDEFTSRGGAIGLFPDKDRIGIDINRISERRAELQISSRLLRLARKILE